MQSCAIALPEAAPSDVMLAKVFHTRRLYEQFVDLVSNAEFLVGLEIVTGKFLLHSGEYLYCTCVLDLTGFVLLVIRI